LQEVQGNCRARFSGSARNNLITFRPYLEKYFSQADRTMHLDVSQFDQIRLRQGQKTRKRHRQVTKFVDQNPDGEDKALPPDQAIGMKQMNELSVMRGM
jgi:hypothetical protein